MEERCNFFESVVFHGRFLFSGAKSVLAGIPQTNSLYENRQSSVQNMFILRPTVTRRNSNVIMTSIRRRDVFLTSWCGGGQGGGGAFDNWARSGAGVRWAGVGVKVHPGKKRKKKKRQEVSDLNRD